MQLVANEFLCLLQHTEKNFQSSADFVYPAPLSAQKTKRKMNQAPPHPTTEKFKVKKDQQEATRSMGGDCLLLVCSSLSPTH